MTIKIASRPVAFWFCILLPSILPQIFGEHIRELEISEGVSVGTKIGYIADSSSPESGPPYLIVPVGSSVDSDLQIDQNSGEIRTKVPLDRETKASYSLVAIPMSGDNIKVVVKVLDENDNAPTFPQSVVNIEFPENTPRDVKRTLPPARDLDLDIYNTQRYNIVSGNTNNAFRLSSHRERDGVLYLDLQINGFLDRETCEGYSLVIEALDGGTPPLRGELTVNITIQDVNDQPPVFNQTRYFASAPENSTVGTTILYVFATDADIGENAEIEYSINRRQSDKDMMFKINSTTGAISVNKPLDFECKELHELVVVARDRGLQPLEATAFVSINVIDVNDNLPTINVIFLSDDATPKISEASQVGEFVARISVRDPDSKTDYSNVNVTLTGGDGHFGLTTRDNIIYLVVVSLPLDRETTPNYTLNIVAMDTGNPPLYASKTINLHVTDVNDNKPEFDQQVYEANVMEVSDPGTSVIQITATDRDYGNNSVITYSLQKANSQHTNWFQIDSRTGLVTTRAHVDCETEPVPKLTVIATDNGFPPLSSSATVLVTIYDVNDNEPIFDQSFYNVTVSEDEAEEKCILKYFATLAGAFAIISSGINLGWTSPYLPKLQSNTSTIPTTTDQGSWCAIAPLLGAPPGAILAAILVDKVGRKATTLYMAPLVTLCFIGIAFAKNIWIISTLRFIIGSAEGALYTALPMYIGEISHPKIRGFLAATIAISAILGTLFINIIGSFTSIFVSSLICAAVPIIHAAAFILVPESPYYYIKKGNFDQAKNSLKLLRGFENVDDELGEMTKAVIRQERTSNRTGLLDLFTVESNRRACLIFLIVCCTNKYSGKNPTMFYTETIFKEAGSTIDATFSVIVYCSVELLAVVLATFFVVDKFGKRLLLMTSTAGCTLSLLAMSVYFFLKDYAPEFDTEYLYWLPITALVSYNIMFSIGLSFGMVTVLSELFPTNVKAKALCLADTFSVSMGALASKYFQILYDQTETMAWPFLSFSLCTIIGLFFIYKYMPETKGKSLEEIQQLLIGQEQYSSELKVRQTAIINDSFI